MKRGSSSKFLIGKQKIQPPKKKTHYLRGRKFKSMILFGVFIKSYYKNFALRGQEDALIRMGLLIKG